LLIPVDVKVRLAKPFCGLRLSAGEIAGGTAVFIAFRAPAPTRSRRPVSANLDTGGEFKRCRGATLIRAMILPATMIHDKVNYDSF
jgi:hypothetical protein